MYMHNFADTCSSNISSEINSISLYSSGTIVEHYTVCTLHSALFTGYMFVPDALRNRTFPDFDLKQTAGFEFLYSALISTLELKNTIEDINHLKYKWTGINFCSLVHFLLLLQGLQQLSSSSMPFLAWSGWPSTLHGICERKQSGWTAVSL